MFARYPYTIKSRVKIFLLAFYLAIAPSVALADPGSQLVTTGGTFYVFFPPGAATPTVVKASPGRLYKVINLSSTAQTNIFQCYDSATGANGQLIYAQIPGINASAVSDVEIPTTTGISCTDSGNIQGGGILVLAN